MNTNLTTIPSPSLGQDSQNRRIGQMKHLLERANHITHLEKEVAALRRIGLDLGPIGQRLPRAFGESRPGYLAQDQSVRNWLFEIRLNWSSETLESVIDIYTATSQPDADFDVDTWTDQLIEISAPASRLGFRALSQASRALLSGRKLVLNSGSLHFPELANRNFSHA
ncbi:hypothetical protein [Pseudomonas sp. FP833]|uniref:hypothetical protein n=1 Tax=Pseudomonas sp. FP833 TaxID=2954102 RepID=UPI0027330684|nr:hypothetical protein [Pseudomonas sp. FP833]WLI50644.1 hypothetical protein PSH63_30365 [Pseudomonas sp. FP833]